MEWQWSLWVILELSAVIGLAILAFYSRHVIHAGVQSVGLTLFTVGTIYMFLNAMEIGTGALATKYMYFKLEYVCLPVMAAIWLAFILKYVHEDKRLEPRTIALLSILPVFVAVLALTNEAHHLFWTGSSPGNNSFLFIYRQRPLLWFSAACNYAIFLYGTFLLSRQLRFMAEPLRGDAFGILLAAVVVLIMSVFESANIKRNSPYPLSPLAWGFAIAFVFIALSFRYLREARVRPMAEQTAINSLNDAFIAIDRQTRVIYMNKAGEKLTGCTLVEAYKRPLKELLLSWPQQILNIVQQPSVTATKELRVEKNGKYSWYEIGLSPMHDSAGNLMGQVLLIRDVTGHIKAEEEKQEIERKSHLASRLASVGEMAAGVAHEINNPLTGVIGYAQLLIGQENILPDIRRDLAAIEDGAQRVASIVKRLLAFSRETKPERKRIDINELIESTLALRDYNLRVNDIKVTTQLAPDLPETVADPGQLQQVFLNLIVNAETEMKLAHGKGKLTITTEKSDNIIKVCVKDDGPGIKPEFMDRIFDPFFTTREVGQGTGLGLSLCYGIITEHNGKIYAESKPGKGANFIMELPIVTEAEWPKPPEPAVEEPKKAAKARILVVDDEQVTRDVVDRVLTGEGYKVETVDNAADALKKIASKKYNLMLVDIKMPDMNGVELYKRIQKIAKPLVQRVVFITGDIMGADTEKFLSETKVAHIDKPFDREQLSREVKRALTGGR